MSCGFAYEDCDDHADIWRERTVARTRKERRCDECGDLIPVGTRCTSADALADGRWFGWSRCQSCTVYAEYAAMALRLCPLWGGLGEFVERNSDAGSEVLTLSEWREADRERQAAAAQ